MDIGGSNGGSAALPTLKGCTREIVIFLNQSEREQGKNHGRSSNIEIYCQYIIITAIIGLESQS